MSNLPWSPAAYRATSASASNYLGYAEGDE
jgi:hypothetical protein